MIALILIVAWIVYQAKIDQEHFDRGQYFSDHKSRFIARGLVAAIIAVFSIKFAIITALLYWTLFDATLNKLRGLDYFYIGGEAETDKFFADKPKLYKISKYVALGLAVFASLL